MEYDSFSSMSTTILLAAEGPATQQGFEQARSFIETCAQRFTRFSSTSELSRLNQAAGTWFQASPEMFDLLKAAFDCYTTTAGLFDPSILPELEQAGYNRSIDEIRASEANDFWEAGIRPKLPPFSAVELRAEDSSVHIPAGMRIDLGGIAKGWIAEKAARRLEKFSSNCAVNIGGDLFLIGCPNGEPNWEIALEDPRNPDNDLITLQVEPGAVATSSVAKRTWHQNGVLQHHLIDPRSGVPAESRWISVTAFAPSGSAAEACAKAMLIGGSEFARILVSKNLQIYYLAVDKEGRVWVPEKGKEYSFQV